MGDKIKILDITSMLNEDVQKALYIDENISSIRKSDSLYVINNLTMENLFNCIKNNSLYFNRYNNYKLKDEIRYDNYNATFCGNISCKEKRIIERRNELFGNSAYVLPMYHDKELSTLHFDTYGGKGNIAVAVMYNLSVLLKNLEDNAWKRRGKTENNTNNKLPIISLSEKDRIFCDDVQYMEPVSEDKEYNYSFDPANAVLPFYLKRNSNKTDKEYRLCLIKNPEIRYDKASDSVAFQNMLDTCVEGVYVPVGNIFESIESLIFKKPENMVFNNKNEEEEKKERIKYEKEYEKQIGELKAKAENAGFTLDKQDNYNEIYYLYQFRPKDICGRKHYPIFAQSKEPLPESFFDVPQERIGNPNSFTIFGNKYDSMKQRYILMRGDRQYNYNRYNTSLKYDMLLWGKVTITDAQYFDGMLFTQMIENGHFCDFIHCAYKHDGLEIRRRRSNSDELILKLFGKNFFYSSIQSYEMAKKVEKRSRDLLKYSEDEKKKYCKDIDSLWNFIGKEQEFEEYSEQIELMKKWYNTLFNVHKGLFKEWEAIEGEGFEEKYYKFLKDGDSFNKAIEITEGINSYTISISSQCEEIIEKCINYEKEFSDVSGFRTGVLISNIDKIIQKAYQAKNKNQISKEDFKNICDACNYLTNEFNRAYNKVLAIQHKCRFIEYSNKSNPVFDGSSQETEYIKFDKEALNYISACSWKEFDKLLSDRCIQEARNELFNILEKGADNKDFSEAISSSQLKAAYDKLDKAVSNYCSKAADSMENKPEYSIFDIDAESTNYFTVRGNKHHDGDLYFIGCGSELMENKNNDLGILIPNMESGPKLFCIYFDERPGDKIDSIICPAVFEMKEED